MVQGEAARQAQREQEERDRQAREAQAMRDKIIQQGADAKAEADQYFRNHPG